MTTLCLADLNECGLREGRRPQGSENDRRNSGSHSVSHYSGDRFYELAKAGGKQPYQPNQKLDNLLTACALLKPKLF